MFVLKESDPEAISICFQPGHEFIVKVVTGYEDRVVKNYALEFEGFEAGRKPERGVYGPDLEAGMARERAHVLHDRAGISRQWVTVKKQKSSHSAFGTMTH